MTFMIKPFISFFVVTLLLSCSSGENKTDQTLESDQLLRMSIGGSPQTIDPHQVTGTPGVNVISALSENLLSMNYTTIEVIPAGAEKWTVSEGGLKYRFSLRKDAKWSNGEPVTASDYVYSWRRLMAPGLGNQYATDYYFIKNAEAIHKGEIKDFTQLGVVAINKHELEFVLSRKDPLFLKRLASPQLSPVHQATVEKHGAFDDPTNPWIKAGNYVGNGPFVLHKWEINKVIEVRKNPFYWNNKAVFLDKILFDPAETETAEERLFRSGQLDVMFGRRIPVEKIAKYRNERPDEFISQADYATYFYLFNTQKAPFNDVNVRRAFTFAVDKELITRKITKNDESAAYALSPTSTDYSPPRIASYDPQKAKEYLAKAGYPNGEGFPSITLSYNTSDLHRKVAIAIQQMWKSVLNIDVTLENQEWKVFLNFRQHLNHDIARSGSISNLGDPIDFLSSYTTGHGMNDTGWSNLEFDKLIAQSNTAENEEERYKLIYQAESILLQDLPLLPLYFYNSTYLKSPKVKGFEFNSLGQAVYTGVYIEPLSEK